MRLFLACILNRIRLFWYFSIRHRWVKYGTNVHVQFGCFFGGAEPTISIGNYVGIGLNCIFQSKCQIGNDVLIASNCHFINRYEHRYDIVGKTIWNSGGGESGIIQIEDDTWIGESAVIVAPVIIGKGAIVAAGSVVTRDVLPYSIVGGNPSQLIKMRFSNIQIEEHEKIISL